MSWASLLQILGLLNPYRLRVRYRTDGQTQQPSMHCSLPMGAGA